MRRWDAGLDQLGPGYNDRWGPRMVPKMKKAHWNAGLQQLGPVRAYENPPQGGSIVPGFWRPEGERPVISRNKAIESIGRRAAASTRARKVRVTLANVRGDER